MGSCSGGHRLPGTWRCPTDPPAPLSLPRSPGCASLGRHGGLPWMALANERCQPGCHARGRGRAGARNRVSHGGRALSHPVCQRGCVSLSCHGDGPSGCLLPPGRRKGVCPAVWRERGRGGRGTDRSQDSPSSGGYCCFAHVMFAYFSGSAFIGCCWLGAGASVCRAVSTMLALALSR